MEPEISTTLPLGTPSHKAQSWGVVISILIIVLMILVGAFYSWGKRIAEQNPPITNNSSNTH